MSFYWKHEILIFNRDLKHLQLGKKINYRKEKTYKSFEINLKIFKTVFFLINGCEISSGDIFKLLLSKLIKLFLMNASELF